MNTRRVVVPDLGDAVIEAVSDLTEMLIALVDETLESELPSVLADGFGLEALDRIWGLIKPTQERTAPRLFAPEWRAEYLRLSVVELHAADLATMGEAIRALGAGLLTGDPQITAALVDFADAAPPAAVAGRGQSQNGIRCRRPCRSTFILSPTRARDREGPQS